MGGVKHKMFTGTDKENEFPTEPNTLYFCFMCSTTKIPIDDGCHQDPFDEDERICSSCHQQHEQRRREEQDAWGYYDTLHSASQEE